MDFADMLIQTQPTAKCRRLLQLSFKLDPDSQVRSMSTSWIDLKTSDLIAKH